jgi:hypothetical protein
VRTQSHERKTAELEIDVGSFGRLHAPKGLSFEGMSIRGKNMTLPPQDHHHTPPSSSFTFKLSFFVDY